MAAFDTITSTDQDAIDLHLVSAESYEAWHQDQSEDHQAWLTAHDFKAEAGALLALPSKKGALKAYVVGIKALDDLWSYGSLPSALPLGTYKIKTALDHTAATAAVLGWSLGSYAFDWYKAETRDFAQLVAPKKADLETAAALAEGIWLTRDLINLPAGDLGPVELAQAAKDLAVDFKASCRVVADEALLSENLATIHIVGQGAAADRRPCLIDINWEGSTCAKKAPSIALVGKGVCFDSGGLNIKPDSAMKLMKKDMGGAAHVLGLAKAIMLADLPVRLRVIVPAVENSVSAEAMRPMDVVTARNGKTIEIGHTDAEGRVVLADSLTLASEAKPDLILDFATLTGAARVALGTEVPAVFCNDEDLNKALMGASAAVNDPLWRMPLVAEYRPHITGKTADLTTQAHGYPFAGAITAALFLQEFVEKGIPWAHVDVMAWNISSKAGRPEGGEAMGLRAAFEMIKNHR